MVMNQWSPSALLPVCLIATACPPCVSASHCALPGLAHPALSRSGSHQWWISASSGCAKIVGTVCCCTSLCSRMRREEAALDMGRRRGRHGATLRRSEQEERQGGGRERGREGGPAWGGKDGGGAGRAR